MATPSSADRRGRSCAGPKIMSQPLKNMSNIVCVPVLKYCPNLFKNMSNIACGPAQDRPLRSADLAGKIYGVQFCFVLTALWSLDDRSLVM